MSLKPNSANSTNRRPNVLQSQSHSNVIELESEEGKFEQTAQRRLRSPSVSSTKSLVKHEFVEEVKTGHDANLQQYDESDDDAKLIPVRQPPQHSADMIDPYLGVLRSKLNMVTEVKE